MDFYHGTIVGGITELHPYVGANLAEPCVYLTTSKQLALHYILDKKSRIGSSPMLNIGKDGILTFQPMFSGALEYLYKGLSGYLYHCTGSYPLYAESGVRTCAISTEPVAVKDVEFIEDVYEHIIEYAKYGTLIIEKYEELPRYRHDLIRGHVVRGIKNEKLLENPESPVARHYQEKWPKYWDEAKVLFQYDLL